MINRKWFEEHLNWATVIGLVLSYLITFIVAGIVALIDPENNLSFSNWLISVLYLGLPLIPGSWFLKRKSQNLWWLPLIWFPPIGWIILFILPNKKVMGL